MDQRTQGDYFQLKRNLATRRDSTSTHISYKTCRPRIVKPACNGTTELTDAHKSDAKIWPDRQSHIVSQNVRFFLSVIRYQLCIVKVQDTEWICYTAIRGGDTSVARSASLELTLVPAMTQLYSEHRADLIRSVSSQVMSTHKTDSTQRQLKQWLRLVFGARVNQTGYFLTHCYVYVCDPNYLYAKGSSRITWQACGTNVV